MLRFLLVMTLLLVGWLQPSPTATEPISLDNADRIEQLQQIGYGSVSQLLWKAESRQVGAVTSSGVLFYHNNGIGVSTPVTTFEANGSILNAVTSGDETTLLIEQADHSLVLQNAESGDITEIHYRNNPIVYYSALSSDGRLLAISWVILGPIGGTQEGFIDIFDARTGVELQRITVAYENASIEFLPDSSALFIFNPNGVLQRWDVNSATVTTLPIEDFSAYAFSADGRSMVVYDSQYQLTIWDLTTFESRLLAATQGYPVIALLAFSPNGEWLATYGSGVLSILSAQTGETLAEWTPTNSGTGYPELSFSPDSSVLAFSDSARGIHLYDTQTWEEVNVLEGFLDVVWTVAFHPDGNSLAYGANDGQVYFRNLHDHTWQTFQNPNGRLDRSVIDIAFFTGGGGAYVLYERGGVLWWNLDEPQGIVPIRNGCPDGGCEPTGDPSSARAIALNPSNTASAFVTDLGIEFRNRGTTPDRVMSITLDEYEVIDAIALNIDNTRIVAISNFYPNEEYPYAAGLNVWDVESAELIASVTNTDVNMPTWNTVAYSPDGTFIVTGDDAGTITLWDADDLTQIATLTGHRGGVMSVIFSDDGSLIISGGRDSSIHLWDVATFTEVRALAGHTSWISDLALSVDGTMLASASYDGTVRLWGVR